MQCADEIVREVEAGKAQMFATPGNTQCNQVCNELIDSFLTQARMQNDSGHDKSLMISQSAIVMKIT